MKHSYADQQPDVEELIASHSELVRKIAWQIHGRARHITEIEDIMQPLFGFQSNLCTQI